MKRTKILVVIFSLLLIIGSVYSSLAQVSGWPFPFSSVSPATLPSLTLTSPLSVSNGGTGQTTLPSLNQLSLPTANYNMNGNKLVGLLAGTVTNDSLAFGQSATLSSLTLTAPLSIANGGTAQTAEPLVFNGEKVNVVGGGSAAQTLQLFDTTVAAVNPNKYFRIATGTLQIINSGFTLDIVDLTDTGTLTIKGGLNATSASLNADAVFSASPTVNWSSHLETLTGATAGAAINFFVARKAINITRFTASLKIQGATCTTLPTIILKKCTAGFVPSTNACTTSVTLSTISVANATFGFDSGVIAQTAAAGDVVIITETVLPAGCGTNPSGLNLSAEYEMQ